MVPAVEVWNPNTWITREFPKVFLYSFYTVLDRFIPDILYFCCFCYYIS